MNEKISALLDGELRERERDEVLRYISRDPELADVWSRYHLYRAILREETVVHVPNLTHKITEQLALESGSEKHDHKTAFAPIRTIFDRPRPLVAIAASLIAATVLVVFMNTYIPSKLPQGTLATVNTTKSTWEMDLENEDTLNGFLVEHGEFVPASGMNGLMAYAKFVSYDSGQ